MKTLPETCYRVLREIARTLFDAGQGVPEVRLNDSLAELKELLGAASAMTRLAMRMSLFVLQMTPIILIGRWRRFTSLSPADRLRFLQKFENGFFGLLLVVVKLYLCMVYFEHPDVCREMRCEVSS